MRVRSSSLAFLRPVACAGVIAALAATAHAAGPSETFTVTGAVQTPASYDLSALRSLPSQTQTVSYGSGAGPQTHTYTGTSLWGIVDRAGFQTQPGVKNDILNGYVVATGSDGYLAVYSLGELSPNFGNRPNLVAYSQTVQEQSVAWAPTASRASPRRATSRAAATFPTW